MQTVGRYRIVRELGRGGMGVVYEAFDPAMERTVALKVILCLPHSTTEEYAQLKTRFLREAAAAGRLSHPNIVHINNQGEEDGLPYLDMDFVAGKPLKTMLAPGVPVSLEMALAILTQIAAALDHAHAKGIVHRDIKPPNILVEPDGLVKLTDFGIAHISSQTITRTGVTMGTIPYMSPEQLQAKKIDGRTDQFSLGVMAYEMLAGELPFAAPTDAALMLKIIGAEPKALHEVNARLPRAVSQAVGRALSKDPERRFGTCAEFVRELRTAAAYTPPREEYVATVREPGSSGGSTHRSQRWPLLAACALVVLAIAGWFVRQSNGTGKTAPTTDVARKEPAAKALPPAAGQVEQKEETIRSAPPPSNPTKPTGTTAKNAQEAAKPATEESKVQMPIPKGPATKVNDKDGLTYVWIPPNTFQMGCSPADSECYPDESPAHEVTISKGFWMGQTPVTQEAYRRVVGEDPSHFKGDKLPVEQVNWNEAQSYCQAAGAGMRLPTEAEWEYAARAGTTGSRYGGLDQIAWYNQNSGSTTHPVGQKQANAFGLYDMLGNVWEWVADTYAAYPAGHQTDPKAVGGKEYVLRGGSWDGVARNARASYRGRNEPENRDYGIGLRCAGN